MYALTGLYADASNSSGSDGERDTSGRGEKQAASKPVVDTPFHKGHSRNASLGKCPAQPSFKIDFLILFLNFSKIFYPWLVLKLYYSVRWVQKNGVKMYRVTQVAYLTGVIPRHSMRRGSPWPKVGGGEGVQYNFLKFFSLRLMLK
jgi:hypothetical protein